MVDIDEVPELTNDELIIKLEERKIQAVNGERFEEAIILRDQINDIKSKKSTKNPDSDITEKTDQAETKTKKEINDMKVEAEEDKTDKISYLMGQLNNNSVLDESKLRNSALKKMGEVLHLLTESNALTRLKKHDSKFFYKHYNGKVDNMGYLYDTEGRLTSSLPSQIDTSGELNGIQDERDAISFIKLYINKFL